jgi:hypothetical protein
VDYEFFNPKAAKEIEVGFEAYSPSGDVNSEPLEGEHPYISDFTVLMNEEHVKYKVAIVKDSVYYVNGVYKSIPVSKVLKELKEYDDLVDFTYVYHFKALFKNGLNTLKHTYIVDLSSSVSENYSLRYILTAATRWSNHQIDDFTLKIDMGQFQDLSISKTFFEKGSDWTMTGRGKYVERKGEIKSDPDMCEFFVQTGALVFQKKNFHPMGEIGMSSYNSYMFGAVSPPDNFNSSRDPLPFSVDDQNQILKPTNEPSKQVLKNLPYARRGYIFKKPELQAFYSRQKWYLPDPAYVPQMSLLSKEEQEWLIKLGK